MHSLASSPQKTPILLQHLQYAHTYKGRLETEISSKLKSHLKVFLIEYMEKRGVTSSDQLEDIDYKDALDVLHNAAYATPLEVALLNEAGLGTVSLWGYEKATSKIKALMPILLNASTLHIEKDCYQHEKLRAMYEPPEEARLKHVTYKHITVVKEITLSTQTGQQSLLIPCSMQTEGWKLQPLNWLSLSKEELSLVMDSSYTDQITAYGRSTLVNYYVHACIRDNCPQALSWLLAKQDEPTFTCSLNILLTGGIKKLTDQHVKTIFSALEPHPNLCHLEIRSASVEKEWLPNESLIAFWKAIASNQTLTHIIFSTDNFLQTHQNDAVLEAFCTALNTNKKIQSFTFSQGINTEEDVIFLENVYEKIKGNKHILTFALNLTINSEWASETLQVQLSEIKEKFSTLCNNNHTRLNHFAGMMLSNVAIHPHVLQEEIAQKIVDIIDDIPTLMNLSRVKKKPEILQK